MFGFFLFSLDPPSEAKSWDDNKDGSADRWEFLNGQGGVSIYMDTTGNGQVDYILEQDKAGYKKYEALDFNHDGQIDDFYFYNQDVLQRREIDSNFDGQVDIWVRLAEGVYVEGYDRDTNFDGKIDLSKTFGEN